MAKNEKRSLQDIFEDARNAQKGQEGKILDEVYTRYLPAINAYMSEICCTFGLMEQEVMDMYSETISYMCDHVLKDAINVSEFDQILKQSLTARFKNHADAEAEPATISLNDDPRLVEQAGRYKVRDDRRNRESLLFTIEVMRNLAKNDELARQQGVTSEHIKIYLDNLGINGERKPYSIEMLAKKYGYSESRIKAMLVAAKGAVRSMKELEPIRAEL